MIFNTHVHDDKHKMAHQWLFWIQPHTFIESSCCSQAVDCCASDLHGLATVDRKRGMNF